MAGLKSIQPSLSFRPRVAAVLAQSEHKVGRRWDCLMDAVYEVIPLLGAEGVSDNRHLAMHGKL
jgi:hypothetical protein